MTGQQSNAKPRKKTQEKWPLVDKRLWEKLKAAKAPKVKQKDVKK